MNDTNKNANIEGALTKNYRTAGEMILPTEERNMVHLKNMYKWPNQSLSNIL